MLAYEYRALLDSTPVCEQHISTYPPNNCNWVRRPCIWC